MKVLDEHRSLVRIFIGGTKDATPSAAHADEGSALIERIRAAGFVDARPLLGSAALVATGVLRTIGDAAPGDAPLAVIEVVVEEGRSARLLEIVEELLPLGLVTVERLRVLRFATRSDE